MGSVRLRITLVVTIVFGVTLTLAGFLFLNRVEAALVNKIKEADRAELERVSAMFKSGDPVPSVLPPLPNRPSSQLQALGPTGEVVAATPGLAGQGPLLSPAGSGGGSRGREAPVPPVSPPSSATSAPHEPSRASPGQGIPASVPPTAPLSARPPANQAKPPAQSPGSETQQPPGQPPGAPVPPPTQVAPSAQAQAPAPDAQPPTGAPVQPSTPNPKLPPGPEGRPQQPAMPAVPPTASADRAGSGPVTNPRPTTTVAAEPVPTTATSTPPATAEATRVEDAAGSPSTSAPADTVSAPTPRPDSGDYALSQLPVNTDSGSVDLVVLSPLADVRASVDALGQFLRIVIPLLVTLIGLTAWFLTGRALRPVAQMTQQVQDVTASTLHERVAVPRADDEIANLARTMNGMLERLEEAARRQRQFVSDASHELRSPVTSIRTELEVALLHPDATDWADVGKNVLAEDERLERIVGDLLALARLDEQGWLDTNAEVDLGEIVEAEAARARRLPVQASSEAARVVGRSDELARMVGHLLDNAARHGNTKVAVAVDATSGGHVVVRVDDDGSGIAAEDRLSVFERFGRLQEGRSRDSGGAGLGLAVVKRIAERHGGTVTATDSPFGGARFEVSLPRPAGPTKQAAVSQPPTWPHSELR